MAFFGKSRLTTNNLERMVNAASFSLDGIASDEYDIRGSQTNAMQLQVNYADGDVVVVGILPKNSNVIKLLLNVKEAFPAGTTIDIDILSDNLDGASGILNIATGVVVTESDVAIQIPLPTGGCRNADGTALTDVALASMWIGDTIPFYVGVTLNGANLDGTGLLDANFVYEKFATNIGAYTGGV